MGVITLADLVNMSEQLAQVGGSGGTTDLQYTGWIRFLCPETSLLQYSK